MSDLIAFIHSENNPRRFQKTREDTTPKGRARRRQVGPAGPTYMPPSPLGPTCHPLDLCFGDVASGLF